jgi:hypothetical protein
MRVSANDAFSVDYCRIVANPEVTLKSWQRLPVKSALCSETDNIEAMSAKPLFDSGWELPGIRSAQVFFAALPEILPLPTNLCFEGTSIKSDVQSLLASNEASQTLQIRPGTIWPKPSVFHVRATEQFLDQLAALARHHPEPEICDHFHAYSGNQGLMQWYDAFSGDALLIAESIAEAKVQTFTRKLGVPYAPWRARERRR